MSTNAQVRAAWKAGVFDLLLPVKSYSYIFEYDSSEQLVNKGYTKSELNHWQYEVSSIERPLMYQRNELEFLVTVRRIFVDDPKGLNKQALLDDYRTLLGYVDDMGVSWTNTIDLPIEFPRDIRPRLIQWGSISAWEATAVFKGVKEITP